eukprot:gene9261-biopygen9186
MALRVLSTAKVVAFPMGRRPVLVCAGDGVRGDDDKPDDALQPGGAEGHSFHCAGSPLSGRSHSGPLPEPLRFVVECTNSSSSGCER